MSNEEYAILEALTELLKRSEFYGENECLECNPESELCDQCALHCDMKKLARYIIDNIDTVRKILSPKAELKDNNSEREKFVELIMKCQSFTPDMRDVARYTAEYEADYLMANGAMLKSVDIGDKVYFPNNSHCGEIEAINITKQGISYEWVSYDVGPDETEVWDDGSFSNEDIGKSVFLSFEALEKARKESLC